MKTLLVILVIGLLVLTACSNAAPAADQGEPTVPADLENVETIDQDLNLSDLDSLDQDLDFG